MSLYEQSIQILRELGLTLMQSKIYVAIIRLGGSSPVQTISNFSGVARQDAYRTIAELQKLGIVEKVIATPNRFKPTPLQETVSLLLEINKQKICKIQKEADRLATLISEKIEEPIEAPEREQFVIVSEKTAFIRSIKRVVEDTSKYALIMTSWSDCLQLLSVLHEVWSNILEKKVNVRWLAGKKENSTPHPEILADMLTKPNFFLRFLPHELDIRFGFSNGTRAVVATSSNHNATAWPALIARNPVLVSLTENYFETIWRNSSEMQR